MAATETATQLLAGLCDKTFSSEELTRYYLDRIKDRAARYNCFITLNTEAAMTRAKAMDRARAVGRGGALCGLPLAHKDIFCTKGLRTSCGSRMLADFVPPYDATVVRRLDAAGAVMLGKTNMDEFAMGSSNETSHFGPVRNPWDVERVPGGSSGGSAAAVAAGLTPAATGTDTGGSIRQPAALCGITGFKPSYGRVSRYGMVAFASSLDQAGPLSRSAEDAALLFSTMAGFDPMDSTSINAAVPTPSELLDSAGTAPRIGFIREQLEEDQLHPAAAQAVREAMALLAGDNGGQTLSLPHANLGIAAYYVIASAECCSNLARYDGVRYGHRSTSAQDSIMLTERSRTEGFGLEVKRRILSGNYVLSQGYYEAYYRKAQKLRRLIQQDFQRAFETVDLLIGPTAPGPAFRLGEQVDPLSMYRQDLYTIPASLAGLPAVSVPAGFADGQPLGLQIIGPYLGEAQVLAAAHRFQQRSNWHLQSPAAAA